MYVLVLMMEIFLLIFLVMLNLSLLGLMVKVFVLMVVLPVNFRGMAMQVLGLNMVPLLLPRADHHLCHRKTSSTC